MLKIIEFPDGTPISQCEEHWSLRNSNPAHLLEGDVSMSCNSRYPVPIMSPSASVPSDLTLEEWLQELLRYNNKGIQLDFQSTEVVEPACRVLARVADHVSYIL
ncbi:uncharacterized protein TNCV_1570332 [Trichonephila clavipes]|uniref:Menorin-like domain-containing protein n=1 Tax=Trichonephila clavipes TaxID=2585209 RepID=A0A8X6SKR4_TRICX|nr:uncharacterized protein TNCV_1570332 [Trichonephila clavipes]